MPRKENSRIRLENKEIRVVNVNSPQPVENRMPFDDYLRQVNETPQSTRAFIAEIK